MKYGDLQHLSGRSCNAMPWPCKGSVRLRQLSGASLRNLLAQFFGAEFGFAQAREYDCQRCMDATSVFKKNAVFDGSTMLAQLLLCTLRYLVFTFRQEKLLRGLLEDTERSRIMASSWRTSGSEEHPSELQSLMRISYAVFCLKKKKNIT